MKTPNTQFGRQTPLFIVVCFVDFAVFEENNRKEHYCFSQASCLSVIIGYWATLEASSPKAKVSGDYAQQR